MSGPWDKYGSTATAEPEQDGPWQKYAAPKAGPGRGGRMPAGSPTAKAPDPKDLSLMGRFAGGVDQITNLGGNRPGQKLKGLHNVITGASEIASPMLIPAAVAAPAATAVGLAGSAAGGALARKGASMAGASEDVQDLAGEAGSIAGGAAGGKFGPQLVKNGKAATAELLDPPARVKRAYAAARGVTPKNAAPAGAPDGHVDVAGKTFPVREQLRDIGGAWDKDRKVWTVPKEHAQRAQDIVAGVPEVKGAKPGYGARGERSPEDLGKLPGDAKPARGPLKAPVAVDASKNDAAASGMAKIMKTQGISHTEASSLTPIEWQLVASNAGLRQVPSAELIQMAIAKLKASR